MTSNGAVLGDGSRGERTPISVGDRLPELVFETELSMEQAQHLGLDSTAPVSLALVEKDLLVMELLIAQCFKCQKQAPIFEETYQRLTALEDLRDRVAVVGLGVGNTIYSIDLFRQTYDISFPLLPDDSLAAYNLLGRPGRAPYALFARRDEDGNRIVVAGHGGGFSSSDDLLEEIKVTLEYDLSVIRGEEGRQPSLVPVESVMSRSEIEELLSRSADTLVGDTRKSDLVTLESGEEVYMITAGYGVARRKLFAKVESRRTICGDCHDSHFIYVFDSEGLLVDFIPISLVKVGNVPWEPGEVAFLKDRLIGKSLATGEGFDPRADALTGATITCILVYESLRYGRELFDSLVSEGHIRPR